MKSKYMLSAVLVVFALLSVACAAQEAVDEPGNVTESPSMSTDAATDPEQESEADMSPTGAVEVDGTAVIPATGPEVAGLPDDPGEMTRVLIAAGATVDLGDTVEMESVSVPGQIFLIDGEEVQIFSYASAQELEVQISQLPEGDNPEDAPHFFQMGTMLVRYTGRDPGVRDLLEDVLGAQAVR